MFLQYRSPLLLKALLDLLKSGHCDRFYCSHKMPMVAVFVVVYDYHHDSVGASPSRILPDRSHLQEVTYGPRNSPAEFLKFVANQYLLFIFSQHIQQHQELLREE